jgi:hypothetical protein
MMTEGGPYLACFRAVLRHLSSDLLVAMTGLSLDHAYAEPARTTIRLENSVGSFSEPSN